MKRVEGWLEIEQQLEPDGEWTVAVRCARDVSIEQGRAYTEDLNRGLDWPHRLVYVRVETSREVQD